MFVLLQIYPPEANDSDEICCCLDVIAVDPSEAELKRYLAAYEYRYRAACEDFNDWDDTSKAWSEEHNHMIDELTNRYGVYGDLIKTTKFKIVECWTGGKPISMNENPVAPIPGTA
jgi:hypothetical protein